MRHEIIKYDYGRYVKSDTYPFTQKWERPKTITSVCLFEKHCEFQELSKDRYYIFTTTIWKKLRKCLWFLFDTCILWFFTDWHWDDYKNFFYDWIHRNGKDIWWLTKALIIIGAMCLSIIVAIAGFQHIFCCWLDYNPPVNYYNPPKSEYNYECPECPECDCEQKLAPDEVRVWYWDEKNKNGYYKVEKRTKTRTYY